MTTQGATLLPEQSGSSLLILIDGHALVHRAFHAIREPMVSAAGEDTTAVYGFVRDFMRALSEWKPSHCIVTFDVSAPTFRHKAFDKYKAHRPATPPELRPQFERVRQFMQAFGVPVMEHAGFEADDLLGTLSRQAEQRQIETLILTGDSDILQLVSPTVRVMLSSGRSATVFNVTQVKERYGGLGPEFVAEIKALEGDSSDNIPGVPRVGRKTAIKLLSEYGSIEGIYEHIDVVKPPSVQKSLRANRDLAFQCKMLTTIRRDVPVTLEPDDVRFGRYDGDALTALMRELNFNSLVDRIRYLSYGGGAGQAIGVGEGAQLGMMGTSNEDDDRIPVDYSVVDTEDALDDMIRTLLAADVVAFDTETTSASAMTAELVGLSFSNEAGKGWYVPVGHQEGTQLDKAYVLDRLRPLLSHANGAAGKADKRPIIAAHNANYDMTVLEGCGVSVDTLGFDTMLAAHLLGTKQIGLKALALSELNENMTPISDLIGRGRKQITMDKVAIADAAPYAAADADMTRRLVDVFASKLHRIGTRSLFDTVEMPLTQVLVRMQHNGVAIDTPALNAMSAELGERLAGIEAGMYDVVGHEFNINSSQQLGGVLFNELRLPTKGVKRTQRGYSTDAATLDSLKEKLDAGESDNADPRAYEVLDRVLDYRQLAKIKSTYVDALPTMVNPHTGRIHTSYNQTGSATGRMSSNDPNVQNIPVRTELGRQVRRAFVASPGFLLLSADYSQIELRILAHISQDPSLLNAFHSGEDIHAATGASVYGVPIDSVTDEMRRIAKIMNFGVIYGLSPFGIRQQTGFSADEGKRFIATYFKQYPGIRSYIDDTKIQVRSRGYVETLLGRRRYITEIRSRNHNVRASGERMAINMPIQGTAADIIKIAMIRIQQRMDELAMRSNMIIQVHDELIFETHEGEMDQMQEIVTELMPASMQLDVPLDVEMKIGPNWGDLG